MQNISQNMNNNVNDNEFDTCEDLDGWRRNCANITHNRSTNFNLNVLDKTRRNVVIASKVIVIEVHMLGSNKSSIELILEYDLGVDVMNVMVDMVCGYEK